MSTRQTRSGAKSKAGQKGNKAPAKGSKAPAKRPAGKRPAGGKKKRSKRRREVYAKRRGEAYAIYIHRVLKDLEKDEKEKKEKDREIYLDATISRKSMSIMNSFMNEAFERIASEAARLNKYNKEKTMQARDIQTAVRLILPGELAKHAVSEGAKATLKFQGKSK